MAVAAVIFCGLVAHNHVFFVLFLVFHLFCCSFVFGSGFYFTFCEPYFASSLTLSAVGSFRNCGIHPSRQKNCVLFSLSAVGSPVNCGIHPSRLNRETSTFCVSEDEFMTELCTSLAL